MIDALKRKSNITMDISPIVDSIKTQRAQRVINAVQEIIPLLVDIIISWKTPA